MTPLPLTVPNAALAAMPILLILYLMVGRNWGGSKAGPAGWAAAALIGTIIFGADLPVLLVSFGRGMLLALFVLYIIWMALLLYHVVSEAGAIDVIGEELPRLAPDRSAQALLLAWVFGSFLQGVSGFGVPAAVVAPLLVGLQFRADVAVAVALLGHGWAVTFGSLGSSFLALIAATGLPGEQLAGDAALLLALCGLGCGLGVLVTAGGRQGLRRRWTILLLLAAVMGGTQWVVAEAGLWSLAAVAAGLVGLVVAGFLFRLQQQATRYAPEAGELGLNSRLLAEAFAPYLILVGVIVVGEMLLGGILDVVILNFNFPAVETSLGWQTPAGPGRSISLFGHAGALLLYASLLAFLWFSWRGTFRDEGTGYDLGRIVGKTVRGSLNSTIGIVTLVVMAVTMQHAGMTRLLAEGLSSAGALYPFMAPFIGALGAFMTGSNTNSNVVFAALQQQTAASLGLPMALILAAQTAGGAIGSVFAPAKVIVGCSTVAGANDGRVLKLATAYGMGVIVVVGAIVWLVA